MFCEKCGTKMVDNKCSNSQCGFEKFFNPIPVSVCLIPVMDNGVVFLLGVRRNIHPVGGIALPGGFQEIEDVLDAALREVHEETGIDLKTLFPNHPELLNPIALILSTPDNTRNLMFFKANVMINKSDIDFLLKTNETQEVVLIDPDTVLCFSLHKKAVDWFFEQ